MKNDLLFIFLVCTLFIAEPLMGQQSWEQTNGPLGGQINNMAESPNGNLFASTNAGVYKSTDNGNSWFFSSAGLNVNDDHVLIADSLNWTEVVTYVAAKNNTEIFAGTSIGDLFKSTDSGSNWTVIAHASSFQQSSNIDVISFDSNGYIYVVNGGSIFRSKDDGAIWQKVSNNVYGISYVLPVNNTLYLTSSTSGVYKSTDLGDSWVQINNGLIDTSAYTLAEDSGGALYVGTAQTIDMNTFTYKGGVYKSTDGGNSWTNLKNVFFPDPVNLIGFSSNGNILASANGKGIYISTDAGNSWNSMNGGIGKNSILYPKASSFLVTNNNILLCSILGESGIYSYSSIINSWQASNKGIIAQHITCLYYDASTKDILAGTQDQGGVYLTTDNGNNWTQNGLAGETIWSLAKTSNGAILAGTDEGIFKTLDNGTTWNQVYSNFQCYCLGVSPNGTIYGGSVQDKVLMSTDNGATWTSKSVSSSVVIGTIKSISIKNNDTIFAADYGYTNEGGFYRSDDGGATWSLLDIGVASNTAKEITLSSKGDLYALLTYGHLYHSSDNGNSWSEFISPANLFSSIYINSSDKLFINTGGSISNSWYYQSSDFGQSWELNKGIPMNQYAVFMEGQNGSMFAGTSFGGVYRLSSVTRVSGYKNTTPENFSLSQNYPNPFNPSTKIQFSIPKRNFVTLKIYDALGREVATLVDKELSAGTYNVTWNADKFTTGVYICRISAGNYSTTKKMILLK